MRNLVVILSVTVMCSGCGTIAGHDDQGTMDGVGHGLYRGVRTDWQWVAHPEPETELGAPIYCIDMPFSFVADTLFLPVDSIVAMQKPEAGKTQTQIGCALDRAHQ